MGNEREVQHTDSRRLSRASNRVLRRFSAPERHPAFWVVMWTLVLVAEIGALAPFLFGEPGPIEPVQVVFRLVGGSFAACGLIAWRRRPDSYSGRWMTATGFGFFAGPLLALLDAPAALTLAHLLQDLWVLFFVASAADVSDRRAAPDPDGLVPDRGHHLRDRGARTAVPDGDRRARQHPAHLGGHRTGHRHRPGAACLVPRRCRR